MTESDIAGRSGMAGAALAACDPPAAGATVGVALGLAEARAIHAFAPASQRDGERRGLRGADPGNGAFGPSRSVVSSAPSRPGPSRRG